MAKDIELEPISEEEAHALAGESVIPQDLPPYESSIDLVKATSNPEDKLTKIKEIAAKTGKTIEQEAPTIGTQFKNIPPEQALAFIEAAGQSAALGWSDEALGAVMAAAEYAKSEKDVKYSDLYKKQRDELRRHYKKSQENWPKTTLAGELAGSFTYPTLGATKWISAIPEAMAVGAVSAAGKSETESPDYSDMLKWGAYSALPVAGLRVGKSMISTATGMPLIKDMSGQFVSALEGKALHGPEAMSNLYPRMLEHSKSMYSELTDELSKLSKSKRELLKKHGGKKIFLKDIFERAKGRLDEIETIPGTAEAEDKIFIKNMLNNYLEGAVTKKIEYKTLPSKLKQASGMEEVKRAESEALARNIAPEDIDTVMEPITGTDANQLVVRQAMRNKDGEVTGYKKLYSKTIESQDLDDRLKRIATPVREGAQEFYTPSEAESLKRSFSDITGVGGESSPLKTGTMKGFATGLTKDINTETRTQIPGLTEADRKIHDTLSTIESTGIPNYPMSENEVTDLIRKKFLPFLKEANPDNPNQTRIQQYLNTLEKVNPELANKHEKIIKQLGYEQDLISKGQYGYGTMPKSASTVSGAASELLGSTRSLLTTKAGELGTNLHIQSPKVSKFIAKTLFRTAPDIAKKYSALAQATTDRARNAIIFTMMQNPRVREEIIKHDLENIQDEDIPEELIETMPEE